jgi:hypothetical protein
VASAPLAAAATPEAATPFRGALNSRGRETATTRDAARDKAREAARDAARDTAATSDPGPASRWRSSLLRGIGSGDKS